MTLMWTAALAKGSLVYQQVPEATAKKAHTPNRNNAGTSSKKDGVAGLPGYQGLTYLREDAFA
jgi:hypothetical protein